MLVFGLDVGTTSVGFAAVNLDEANARGSILRTGARIFPEARDPDGTPLNQQRRTKRMMRRQLRRRKERRRGLNEALAEAGLLPAFSGPIWASVMASDPYALRKRGLTEPLTSYELGRVLYHLAKRRHFKGHDLEDDAEEVEAAPDEKEAKSNRDTTLKALKAADLSLGRWLAEKPPGERKRGIHATRDVVAAEFEKLWGAQAPNHPQLRDQNFKTQIQETIFAQRPVFWRKNTLGQCRLEPGAPLCPKGAWISQQRRMLEKLNNLSIAGGNSRPLDENERQAILQRLQTQGSMSWSKVRDALKPLFETRDESAKSIKFNLETDGDKGLLGNPLEAKLAEIFGPEWKNHPLKSQIRNRVQVRLWIADYGEIGTQRVVIRSELESKVNRLAARDEFIRDYHVTEAQADALANLKFPHGWEPYSTIALQKLLPELEHGVRFGALIASPEFAGWRAENFPNREQPTGEFHGRLPSPRDPDEARRITQVRNPTVVRTQNELRKVVNNLIALYGKPDLIRIELARDVGKSKRERKEIELANRDQARRRKTAEKDLQSKGIATPSRDDIEKWLLWKESQERDPYTGDQIGFDDLFRTGRYQVEHIWPRSRSLDNGFRNKTLCRTDVNSAKRDKTPFEHFEHRLDEWAAIKDRLGRMMEPKEGMSPGKVKRFLAESIPEDFASRQLNDTGYAARLAISFLKKLWPDLGPEAPVRVQAVSGRVTAQLRKRWGLNYILADDGEKTRADHRHHAVDALAVACTSPAFVKRLSDYYRDEEQKKNPKLPEPWPTIRQDATAAIQAIVVSHRVRKKVSGPLHKETTYGDTGMDVTSDRIAYRVIVQRIPIQELSPDDLAAEDLENNKFMIVDREVRRILRNHVIELGGDLTKVEDLKKAFATCPRMSPTGPVIRKVRLRSKRQERLLVRVHNGVSDPESKHHIAIFRTGAAAYKGEIVSLFEAARRIAKRESVVQRAASDGTRFVMSLSKGDTLRLKGSREGIWVVREVKANGQVTLVPHTEARPTKGATVYKPTINGLMKDFIGKLAVDPIGRVGRAGD